MKKLFVVLIALLSAIYSYSQNTVVKGNVIDANTGETVNALAVDILSNGFKFRHADASFNDSADTFVYLAFAETPFKYSNAR